ncbi:MAG: hypothetical protein U0V75_04815 [Ferruginibacter sp.]
MKNCLRVLLTVLIMAGSTSSLFAQIRNGSIVTIKNKMTQKLLQAKTFIADSAVYSGVVYGGRQPFSKWRIIIAPDGYLFQTYNGSHYLGIQSDTGATHQQMVLRTMSAANRNELLWQISGSPNAYVFRNKKSLKFMTEQIPTPNPYRNVVQSRVTVGPYLWLITPDSTQNNTPDTVKRVLYDVVLNYIAVTEATRNRIDNGDCRRVFGEIKTEVWELNSNNMKVKKLAAYDNKPEFLFKQSNYRDPATAGFSYYQDNLTQAAGNSMAKVTYNLPETLLNNRRLMLVIKAYLGTRHKDSDLSSYDALRMKEEKEFTFILERKNGLLQEMLQDITERNGSEMKLSDVTIPGNIFGGDDAHRLYMVVSWIKK